LTVASNQRVPELVDGVDVRALPLSALEGFVLSRIDGRSTTGDIVSLTGLPLDQVVAILDKLTGLGAVRFRDDARFDPPSGLGSRRSEGPATGVHGAPRRRTPSHSPSSQPRRVFSESGVSSPPPEMPPSGRPRSHSDPSHPPQRPGSNRPPPSATRAEGGSAGARVRPRSSPPAGTPSQPASSDRPTDALPPPPSSTQPSDSPSASAPEPGHYDRRELDEDVELPRERRKQVLDLYYRMSELDHYEALGIPYQADKKEIRSAYFALSKAFHPDSMFRKNLGSFKAKMVAVFQLLTEAYETLSKKKSREEYDAYLRTTKAARMAERALHFAPAEEPKLPPLPPVSTLPKEPPASGPSVPPRADAALPPRELSPEARRLAQEVLARRLRGAKQHPARAASASSAHAPTPPAPPLSPPSPSPTPAERGAEFGEGPRTDTRELLRRLTSTLRDTGQLTGSNDMVTRALRASQAALERGDLSEATQQAARAASLAPDRPELKVQHSKLSAQLSERLANTYIEQARFEMKHNKWASAALTWAKVCEGRPTDADAHRQAAHALLKAGGDLRGAQRYAQKAVFLAPSDIDARILLAQICLTVGLKLNARRELEAAAKLDPAHEMVKNLLADLDKG
jgi:curved DNA-binding protein CbpA